MIFLDTNVFMYAAGAEHPHKQPCLSLLERVARGEIEAITSAEVLQEILHRYRWLDRWTEGREVYGAARSIVRSVLPVSAELTDRARDLLDQHSALTARDALHLAACLETSSQMCSYDTDFDGIAGLTRVQPNAMITN